MCQGTQIMLKRFVTKLNRESGINRMGREWKRRLIELRAAVNKGRYDYKISGYELLFNGNSY